MGNLSFVFDESVIISLSALAARDLIEGSSKIDAGREHGYRIVKTEGWAFVKAAVLNEPVVFGLTPSKTASETEEAIEADPQSIFAVPEQEQAMRPVFPLGALMGVAAEGANLIGHFVNNIPWSYPEGDALFWWAYNPDDDDFSAGTQQLIIFAKHTGVWLRD